MPNPWDSDRDYVEYDIDDVIDETNEDFILVFGTRLDSNLEIRVTVTDGVRPQIGESLRIYGTPRVRGILIGDRMYDYKTPEQDLAEHQAFWDEIDAEASECFLEFDRRYEQLPEPFRRRIDHFRRIEGFRESAEAAELCAAEEAVALASQFRTAEALRQFSLLSRNEKVTAVPSFDDGRSEKVFDATVELAYWYLHAPDRLSEVAGVLEHLSGAPYGREDGPGGMTIVER